MTTSDFARRHGYQETRQDLKPQSYLPNEVRGEGGMMMVRCFEELAGGRNIGWKHFIHVVDGKLPASPDQWEWYRSALDMSEEPRSYLRFREELIEPLMDCDYRLFYSVVEAVCAELGPLFQQITGVSPLPDDVFAGDFNRLLASYGISLRLQSGWVMPLSHSDAASELKYVRQLEALSNGDAMNDPGASLRQAFDALYRKDGGADINGACFHAWSAWETAKELAGGNSQVQTEFPELWAAVTAWQKLIQAGRHPAKARKIANRHPPTEAETHFIVCLLVNAVRLVDSTRDSH